MVHDPRHPADIPSVARRDPELHRGVFEERVRRGEHLLEIELQRRHPVRVASVDPVRHLEKPVQRARLELERNNGRRVASPTRLALLLIEVHGPFILPSLRLDPGDPRPCEGSIRTAHAASRFDGLRIQGSSHSRSVSSIGLSTWRETRSSLAAEAPRRNGTAASPIIGFAVWERLGFRPDGLEGTVPSERHGCSSEARLRPSAPSFS